MTVVLAAVLFLAIPDLASSRPHPSPQYTIVDIGTLGGVGAFAYSMNGRGQAVGRMRLPNGAYAAFVSTGRRTRTIAAGRGSETTAYAINDTGDVAGTVQPRRQKGSVTKAFIWSADRLRFLPTPAGMSSGASGINSHGDVVGYTQSGVGSKSVRQAAIWRSSGIIRLSTPGYRNSDAFAINNAGTIIGWERNAPTSRNMRWFFYRAGHMTLVPARTGNGSFLLFNRINNSDTCVGQLARTKQSARNGHKRQLTALASKAITWQNGRSITLPSMPGSTFDIAYDMNDHGDIVGESFTPDALGRRGMLWAEHRPIDLNRLIGRRSNVIIRTAQAINNHGQILTGAQLKADGTGVYHFLILTPITR